MSAHPGGVRTAVVVGNPAPGSRTLAAALHVHGELVGADPDLVVDLAELGTRLLDFGDEEVTALVEQLGGADLVVVASPTFKASITGVLKVFLDRFAQGTGLRGLAVPLMLGAAPQHQLAVEYALRPVLTEIGAATTRGLYVLAERHDDPAAYRTWLDQVRPTLARTEGVPA